MIFLQELWTDMVSFAIQVERRDFKALHRKQSQLAEEITRTISLFEQSTD